MEMYVGSTDELTQRVVRIFDEWQVPVNPYDNALAMNQIEVAYSTLLARPVIATDDQAISVTRELALDGREHPRIVRCAEYFFFCIVPKLAYMKN